jgi:hypothetical protein
MTDAQRESVVRECLKGFDNRSVTSSGASILDLFTEDAQVFFPRLRGSPREEITSTW